MRPLTVLALVPLPRPAGQYSCNDVCVVDGICCEDAGTGTGCRAEAPCDSTTRHASGAGTCTCDESKTCCNVDQDCPAADGVGGSICRVDSAGAFFCACPTGESATSGVISHAGGPRLRHEIGQIGATAAGQSRENFAPKSVKSTIFTPCPKQIGSCGVR
jgi:hypothetical protein